MNFPFPPNHAVTANAPLPTTNGARQQLQPQQAQQAHQALLYQQQVYMNGLNGGQVPNAAMAGFPTPAGHSAELNYIHAMVEELSRQLAENKRVLEEVVTSVGRVRTRARQQQLGNEELMAETDNLFGGPENMDALISMLTEALEKAKHSRDANAALLASYANVLANMLKQFHDYKAKHIADIAGWHRSYRAQLAEARAENSRLREQIWEMHEHAGKANESLRAFRGKYEEDEVRWERRVDMKAVRQELRFWKRLAMPEMAEDDAYWSDDDDLVDPVEKVRLAEMEKNAVKEQLAGVGGAGEQSGSEEGEGEMPAAMLGGVAMQREDSMGMGMPVPPRPSSAASTGSSGQ